MPVRMPTSQQGILQTCGEAETAVCHVRNTPSRPTMQGIWSGPKKAVCPACSLMSGARDRPFVTKHVQPFPPGHRRQHDNSKSSAIPSRFDQSRRANCNRYHWPSGLLTNKGNSNSHRHNVSFIVTVIAMMSDMRTTMGMII